MSCTENKFGIDKNIPDKIDFKKELNIELNKHYLEQNGKTYDLKWELLDENALEKKDSFPEYFVWIEMFKNGKLQNQGLIKLIVKDKNFHSIRFMNDERLRAVPFEASKEFPSNILLQIKNK